MEKGLVCWSFMAMKNANIINDSYDIIEKCSTLGYSRLCIDPPFVGDIQDHGELEKIKDFADKHNVELHLGFGLELFFKIRSGGCIAHYFEAAKILGSPLLKSALGECFVRFKQNWSPEMAKAAVEKTIQEIRSICQTAEDFSIPVAFENHIDFKNEELAYIFETVDHPLAKIMYDTANQALLCEDPLQAASVLKPYIISTHFKDGVVSKTDDGVNMQWTVPGTGVIPLQEIWKTLTENNPGIYLNAEVIVTQNLPIPYQTQEYKDAVGMNDTHANVMCSLFEKQSRSPIILDQKRLDQEESKILKDSCIALNQFH